MKNGLAFGIAINPDFPEMMSYQAMSFQNVSQYVTAPSPRYWMLWPGIMMMMLYTFADVVMSLIPIFLSKFELFSSGTERLMDYIVRNEEPVKWLQSKFQVLVCLPDRI